MNENIFQVSNGDRPNVRNVAIVISDGKANERESDTAVEAQRARDRGIEIIVVGVTSSVDMVNTPFEKVSSDIIG